MKKILIIGGCGFIGKYVIEESLKKNWEIHVLDKKTNLVNYNSITYHKKDIHNYNEVNSIISLGFDAVLHFAAIAGISDTKKDPLKTINTNILGTTNILESCRANNINQFIFASSVYVHSKHGSIYAATKRCCELIIEKYHEEYNLNYTILRYGSVYGLNANEFNFISESIKNVLAGEKINYYGSGEEQREYIHIKDAAQITVDTVNDKKYYNNAFKITGSQKISIKNLFNLIRETTNLEIKINYNKEINSGHYIQTPYNYTPKVSQRLVPELEYDLEGGIYEIFLSLK